MVGGSALSLHTSQRYSDTGEKGGTLTQKERPANPAPQQEKDGADQGQHCENHVIGEAIVVEGTKSVSECFKVDRSNLDENHVAATDFGRFRSPELAAA
jgi:hypothetical protein